MWGALTSRLAPVVRRAPAILCVIASTALLSAGCGGSSSARDGGRASTASASTEEPWPIEPVGQLQGPEFHATPPKRPWPKKLVVRDLRVGRGPKVKSGDKVTIQFVAIRFNGTVFETSWEFGHPFRFQLGNDELSPGWEKGLPGMQVGGRRELLVPWKMISHTGIIPGTSAKDGQVYVVELLDLSKAGAERPL